MQKINDSGCAFAENDAFKVGGREGRGGELLFLWLMK
jgi:hypothetical protein